MKAKKVVTGDNSKEVLQPCGPYSQLQQAREDEVDQSRVTIGIAASVNRTRSTLRRQGQHFLAFMLGIRTLTVIGLLEWPPLALGAAMFVIVGRDFYPVVDGSMIHLHVRAPPGTYIEVTKQFFLVVEDLLNLKGVTSCTTLMTHCCQRTWIR